MARITARDQVIHDAGVIAGTLIDQVQIPNYAASGLTVAGYSSSRRR